MKKKVTITVTRRTAWKSGSAQNLSAPGINITPRTALVVARPRLGLWSRVLRLLGPVALLSTSVFGQIVLVPDTPIVVSAPAGVTVTPSSDGKVTIATTLDGVTLSGTVELVAPDPPAGTKILGDVVLFPTVQVFPLRQSWPTGVTGRIEVADTGDSSGFTVCRSTGAPETRCNVERLKLDNSDPRRAFLESTINFGTSRNFGPGDIVVRFRWLTNATLEDSIFFATRPTGAVEAGKLAVDPLPNTMIKEGSVPILAIVGFRLLTRTRAFLTLELSSDLAGERPIARSKPISVAPGSDLTAVQFRNVVIDPEDYLEPTDTVGYHFLHAVLYDDKEERLRETSPVVYPLGPRPELQLRVLAPNSPPKGLCGFKLGNADTAAEGAVTFFARYKSDEDPEERANIYLHTYAHHLDGSISLSNRWFMESKVRPNIEISVPLKDLPDLLRNTKEIHVIAVAELQSGAILRSQPYVIPVECVGVTGTIPANTKIGETLKIPVAWKIQRGPAAVDRTVLYNFRNYQTLSTELEGSLLDTFVLTLAPETRNPEELVLRYEIARDLQQPKDTAAFTQIVMLERPITIAAGTTEIPKGQLDNTRASQSYDSSASLSSDPMLPLRIVADLASIYSLGRNSPRGAAPSPTGFVGINRTWRFSQGIPRDGSFSTDLTLYYDPEVLPDHPNFDESKLELIAHDPATGEVERVPSIVDRTRRSVTARIDRLAPVYTLAVAGPFARGVLGAPALSAGGGFEAGLAVVNPDDSPAPVEVRAFNPGRIDLPVDLGPGQQVAGVLNQLAPQTAQSPIAWLTARAGVTTVAAQLLKAGTAFDVLSLQNSPSALSIFPSVQRAGGLNTEFHIANPESVPVEFTLTLFGLDGKSVSKLTRLLEPTSKIQLPVGEAFPEAPRSFSGYAVLNAKRGLFAASVLLGRGAMAATNAQSMAVEGSRSPRLLVPYLGTETATIALVNVGTTEARVTVRAWLDAGSAFGAPIDMLLAPGQAYQSTLAAGFNIASLPPGSIVVESNSALVFGELTIGDAATGRLTAMPLVAEGLASSLVPYMANETGFQTALVIASTGPAANATVTAYRPAGTVIGSTRVTLPANGRRSQPLTALIPAVAGLRGGYLRITADQPVLTYASIDSAISENATILGQSAAPASGGGPGPAPLTQIKPLTARGWPNERNFDNPPPNAVDGSTNTFTWTTNPNNAQVPSYFGVDFAASKPVSRIRMYKDNDGGGGTLSDHFKNLVIEYTTTSASTPLASRTWTRVTGLTNGYQGSELLTAVAVNADGTVTRDSHNSATNGWASLSFAPFDATGIRIAFNGTSSGLYNHYKVHEFEAYGPPSSGGGGSVVPLVFEPASLSWEASESGQTKTVRANNPNSATVTIVRVTSSNPSFVASIAPPAPTISVRYTATGSDAQSGTISVETEPASARAEFRVTGTAAPAQPAITMSPAPPFNLGTGNVGSAGTLAVTLANSGNAPVTINSLSKTNPVFTLLEPLPLTIAAGASARVSIRFTPTAAGAHSDTWTFVTSPASVISSFTVSGTGVAVEPVQALEVSAGNPLVPVTGWDFGSVAVTGQPASVLFRVSNKSSSSVAVTATFVNSRFTLAAPATQPFAIGAGSYENAQILFRPLATDAAVQNGSVTFTANGQTVTVALRGTPTGGGSGGGTSTATLAIDGGTFTNVAGFTGGNITGYFVNRLTPPSYPATLRSVLILFPEDELPLGTAVTAVSASNPSGTGGQTLTGLNFQRTNSSIGAQEVFFEIPVTPLTITSGDFVVGFSALNPAGVYPVVVDTTSGSKQRSYLSSDGVTFRLADNSNVGAGNFGIRAMVDLGGGGSTGAAILTSSITGLALDSTAVNATSPAKTLTISNTGTASATASMTVTGPFTVTPASATLAAGANTTVSVTFRPISATPASQTGTLTVSTPGLPSLTVNLSGTAIATGGGGGNTLCVASPANIVSWYPGDGNANDQTGANSGTIQGGTTFTAGQVGQAFNFNGTTGYVQLGNPANLKMTTGVTVEAWINPRSVKTQTAGPPMGAIFTKWAQIFTDTQDSDSYGLWIVNNNGVINLFSAIHQSGPREPTIQGGTIPLNAWTHVAMTFDGASGRYLLYVNGQQVAAQTSVGNLFPTNRNVNIGREDSYIQRAFDGLIDEPAIYSRALSAAEIQAAFAAGTSGKCKGGATPGGGGGATGSGNSVTVTPTTVAPGQQVTVAWTDLGPTFVRHWVGLYQEGAATTSTTLQRPTWTYTESAAGSIVFTIPSLTPGRYVFHLFTDDGYQSVAATSNVLTVRP